MYRQDYEKSRKYELSFEHKLKTKYKMITEVAPDNLYHPQWDISSTGTTQNRIVKFEVKYCGTDNVYVESGQFVDGQLTPTCLLLTESDYYVFCDDNEIYYHLIPTDKLRDWTTLKEFGKHREIYIDKNNYRLWIFEKNWIYNQSIKINK